MSRKRDNDFVKGVLGRTTGSACDRACSLLPALTDGTLADLDRKLAQSHLEHCSPCRHTAVVMGWMGAELPAMAEIDPGPSFTAAVLERTSGALDPITRAVRAGHSVGPAGLMDRLGRWWEEQIFKPRFALQVAYVATVFLVLITSVPGSPLKGAPSKALAVVQAGPTELPLLGPALMQVDTRVSETLDAGWAEVDQAADRFRQDLSGRAARTSLSRAAVGTHLKAGWSVGRAGELGPAGYEFLQAARATRNVIILWWRAAPSAPDSIPNKG